MSTPPATPPRRLHAFTLIELLVVVAIIAILAALLFAGAPRMLERGKSASSMNNMRQVASAFQLYANENDFYLPARVDTGDKWPRLLHPYLKDTKPYADPFDEGNYIRSGSDPLSDKPNNTSYLMNGFNDVSENYKESPPVKLAALEQPSRTVLLACGFGSANFYMDIEEQNHTTGVLKKNVFNGGANYIFADGSAHFLKEDEITEELFLVQKTPPAP